MLTTIPNTIGKLEKLKGFSLHDNKLSDLPPEIGNLKKLRWLYLHNNKLSTIPDAIGKLSQLSVLDLDSTQFKMLPATIHNLKKLKWILLDEIRCLFILDKALFRPDNEGNTSCSQHVSLKFYECPPSLAAFCRAIHFNAYTLNNNLAVLQEQFSKLSNAAQDELTQRGLGIEDLSSSYTTSNRILSGMLTATCNALTQEEQEQFIHEMIWELPAEYEE